MELEIYFKTKCGNFDFFLLEVNLICGFSNGVNS